MIKKKLPGEVFVHWSESDPRSYYLSADERPEDAVTEPSDVHIVGRYRLIETMTVAGNVKIGHHPTRIGPTRKKKK